VASVTAEPAHIAEPASAPAAPERVVVEPKKRAPAHRARTSKPPRVEPEVPTVEAIVQEPEPIASPVEEETTPLWQRLADEGYYPGSLAAIDQEGGFDTVLGQASAEQLMLLADVARGTGQRDRAILALRQVLGQHGSDPNAPVAAWTLGNELSKAGDAMGAAEAFALYRALSPNGDFAEDALAREFEVAIGQGNVEHARRLAEQYAKDFPDGPRLADIRAELEGERRRPSDGTEPGRPPSESGRAVEAESSASESSSPGGDTR
jgi:hypothetical protein